MRPETISSIAAGSFLNMIAAAHDNLSATVTFYSDNEAAVINSSRNLLHDVGNAIENDMDVTIQNVRLMKKSKFTYSMLHVHGHQDNKNPENISPIAAINIEMDELAGEQVERVIKSTHDTSKPTLFPSQQISVIINNKRVHICIEDALIFQYYEKSLEKHYNNVVHLKPSEFNNVRWNALRLTLRNSQKYDQTLKAIHSQWQTKYVCKRWKITSDALCPLCTNHDETWDHVMKCDNVHMKRVHDESLVKLK